MYAEHVPLISAHMRASPEGFVRGVMFAICSIRQPVTIVPDQLDELEQGDTSCLFGHKRDAYAYLAEHSVALWRDVCALSDPCAAIGRLCDVPGLGVVKAAFVCQLLGLNVACLDARNIKREKRNPRAYRSDGEARKRTPAFKRKVARYVAETSGRAEYYWNAWCEDVAATYRRTPLEISELHLSVCKVREYTLDETFA
jgi:hypothetical protein